MVDIIRIRIRIRPKYENKYDVDDICPYLVRFHPYQYHIKKSGIWWKEKIYFPNAVAIAGCSIMGWPCGGAQRTDDGLVLYR
jgi:hypothetical protein